MVGVYIQYVDDRRMRSCLPTCEAVYAVMQLSLGDALLPTFMILFARRFFHQLVVRSSHPVGGPGWFTTLFCIALTDRHMAWVTRLNLLVVVFFLFLMFFLIGFVVTWTCERFCFFSIVLFCLVSRLTGWIKDQFDRIEQGNDRE